MRKGIRQKPPADFHLLWIVVREHLLIFLLMFTLGLLFICASVLIIYTQGVQHISVTLLSLIFLFAGIVILYLSFSTNFSSVISGYDKGLLRRYGLNINATLTRKEKNELYIDSVKRHVYIDELELVVYFDFQWDGNVWSRGDLLKNEKVFDLLLEGQTIPIRILPWKPESASIRSRALLNQFTQMDAREKQADSRAGESLVEFDEI